MNIPITSNQPINSMKSSMSFNRFQSKNVTKKQKQKQKKIKHGARSRLARVGDVHSSNEAKPNNLLHESPENFFKAEEGSFTHNNH